MLSRNGFVKFSLLCMLALSLPLHAASSEESYQAYLDKYPYIFHLVQKSLWNEAVAADAIYYPPTYAQDEFTHATANPDFLLTIGNHFYQDVEGDWLCLPADTDSLFNSACSSLWKDITQKHGFDVQLVSPAAGHA